MYLKECPKCHGDLYLGEDIHGKFMSCIQCGYLRDLPVEAAPAQVWETLVVDAPETVKKTRRKVPQAASSSRQNEKGAAIWPPLFSIHVMLRPSLG